MRAAGYPASRAEALAEDRARYRALWLGCVQRAAGRARALRQQTAVDRAERYRAWLNRCHPEAE